MRLPAVTALAAAVFAVSMSPASAQFLDLRSEADRLAAAHGGQCRIEDDQIDTAERVDSWNCINDYGQTHMQQALDFKGGYSAVDADPIPGQVRYVRFSVEEDYWKTGDLTLTLAQLATVTDLYVPELTGDIATAFSAGERTGFETEHFRVLVFQDMQHFRDMEVQICPIDTVDPHINCKL